MSQPPLRVLLADDEASLLDSLALYLRHYHHYEVDTAADGQAVLRLLEQTKGCYDVAVLDDFLVPAPGQPPQSLGLPQRSKPATPI
jgi:DNA-binding response OmpR family regulator